MNTLVFLYKRVLNHPLEGSIDAVRADRKINVPVIMTREEVAAVLSLMDGTAQLVANPLRERAADHRSGPAQGQRDRFRNEATDGPFAKRGQRPVHYISRNPQKSERGQVYKLRFRVLKSNS